MLISKKRCSLSFTRHFHSDVTSITLNEGRQGQVVLDLKIEESLFRSKFKTSNRPSVVSYSKKLSPHCLLLVSPRN